MKTIYKMASLALLSMSVATTAVAEPTVVPNGKVTQLTVSTTFSKKTVSLSGDFKPSKSEFVSGPITTPIIIGDLVVTGAKVIGVQVSGSETMLPQAGSMQNEKGETLGLGLRPNTEEGTTTSINAVNIDGYALYANKNNDLSNSFYLQASGTAKPGTYSGTVNVVEVQL